MSKYKIVNKMPFIALLLAVFMAGCGSSTDGASAGPSAVSLGSAASFAVLAGQSVSNTGTTTVSGDLGLSPGTAITGFFGTVVNEGPGVVTGTIHQTDGAAGLAQIDLTAAYTDAKNRSGATLIAGPGELGGLTLSPGVYASASTMNLPVDGVLTLDGNGDVNAVFIFQVGSDLTINSGAKVVLRNNALAKNIFWQVTSSVTLGTTSTTA